jgi:O-antigen ligase
MPLVTAVVLLIYQNVPLSFVSRYFIWSGGGYWSINEREYLYDKAFNMFLDNPIFGKGTGSFDRSGYYPHNIILEIASSWGLVGLGIFCFFDF